VPVADAFTIEPGVGGAYSDMAVSPDGSKIIVTDLVRAAVAVIDVESGEVTSVPVGQRGFSQPVQVVFAPDGSQAYVADSYGNVSVISFAEGDINL
ncbi:YncE family protein, partial [Micromonospora sp. WMMD736]|uniref:YncE family protein n=1 Tax=Micromonospora sp. WMMD736 TaxID=3404112 RepID=UPI003B951444